VKCPKCGEEARSIEKSSEYSSWYCGPCNLFLWDYRGKLLNWGAPH